MRLKYSPFLPSDIQHFWYRFSSRAFKKLWWWQFHCFSLLLESHGIYPQMSVTYMSEITAGFERIRLPKLPWMVSCLQWHLLYVVLLDYFSVLIRLQGQVTE